MSLRALSVFRVIVMVVTTALGTATKKAIVKGERAGKRAEDMILYIKLLCPCGGRLVPLPPPDSGHTRPRHVLDIGRLL